MAKEKSVSTTPKEETQVSSTTNQVNPVLASKPRSSLAIPIILGVLLILSLAALGGGYFYLNNMYSEKLTEQKEKYDEVIDQVKELEEQLATLEKAANEKGNDAGSKKDAPDTADNPMIVSYDSYEAGFYGVNDAADYYEVSYTSGDIVDIEVTPAKDTNIALSIRTTSYGNTSNKVINNTGAGGKETYRYSTDEASETGKITFSFSPVSGTKVGTYSFLVKRTAQNDGGLKGDAPANYDKAETLAFGTYTGYLGVEDGTDYFKFNITDKDILEVTVTPVNNQMNLELNIPNWNLDGLQLLKYPGDFEIDTNYNKGGKGQKETVKFYVKKFGTVAKGSLYIGVGGGTSSSSYGKYQLKVIKLGTL